MRLPPGWLTQLGLAAGPTPTLGLRRLMSCIYVLKCRDGHPWPVSQGSMHILDRGCTCTSALIAQGPVLTAHGAGSHTCRRHAMPLSATAALQLQASFGDRLCCFMGGIRHCRRSRKWGTMLLWGQPPERGGSQPAPMDQERGSAPLWFSAGTHRALRLRRRRRRA